MGASSHQCKILHYKNYCIPSYALLSRNLLRNDRQKPLFRWIFAGNCIFFWPSGARALDKSRKGCYHHLNTLV